MKLFARSSLRFTIFFSALCIVLAFPPWNFWPLIWIALVGWLCEIDRQSVTLKHILFQSLILGFLMSVLGFPWVAYSIKNFGQVPWILAIPLWLLFAVINQPQFFFFALLYRKIPRHPFAVAIVYTAVDFILPKLFRDTLGHSLYLAPNLRQAASLGGAPLLTFLVVFANAWIALALSNLIRNRSKSWLAILKQSSRWALITLLVFSGLIVFGNRQRVLLQNLQDAAPSFVQMAGIQANIGDFEKVAAESGMLHAGEKIMETYFKLSEQALALTPKPQILVWPETAYPSNFRTPSNPMQLFRDQRLETWTQNQGVPLFFGGYDEVQNLDFNSLFMLYPKGDLEVYHKTILLPFGEYIPGFGRDSIFKQLFPAMGFFGTGPGPQVYSVRNQGVPFKISPIICYEALFPSYTLEAAQKGSQLILNLTNDSWFGSYGEPDLHLALTVFRSLETRMPQLRVTNTGISAYISPDGEIHQPTAIQSEAILSVSVPVIDPPKTLLSLWGLFWFPWLCIGLSGVLLLVSMCLNFKQSKTAKTA